MDDYRVQLDVFTGPMDLLLYLIRRDELDIQDIPIARITEQYLAHVKVLEELDPNAVGEFLVLAATLIELKSRALLPAPPIEIASQAEDPRTGLVRQLLEYKRFKDAAARLGHAADERAKRYVRRPGRTPLDGVELEEVQLWDLIGAFRKVMAAIGQGPRTHNVLLDDTPVAVYAERLLESLTASGPMSFTTLFVGRGTRGEIVGMFLALLELIRGQRVRAEQERSGGEIYLFLLDEAGEVPLTDEEQAALAAPAPTAMTADSDAVLGATLDRSPDVDAPPGEQLAPQRTERDPEPADSDWRDDASPARASLESNP